MVIAFLDLLGFKNLARANIETARDTLSIFNEVLQTKFGDEMAHPVDSYSKGAQKFAEDSTITSFKYVISVSDSLIFGSDNPDLFVRQVSNFVATVLIDYGEPFKNAFKDIYSVPGDKRGVVEFDSDGSVHFRPKNVFPIIFRGGIAYGDDVVFSKEGNVWGNEYHFSAVNVSGISYINAVQLEKEGKGPRLFCHKDFVYQLTDENVRRGIRKIEGNDDLYEIVWPYFGCETMENRGNVNTNALKRANEFFLPQAVNLYNYYFEKKKTSCSKEEAVVEHYIEFVKLVCRGILKYVYDLGGNVTSILKMRIKSKTG